MAKKTKCGVCDREVIESITYKGKKICKTCFNKIQDAEIMTEINFDIPLDIVWMGKVAKMGNARAFIIPKSQRPFLKRHHEYLIIIKEVGG